MQSESICANDIEGLDTDTLIPVEFFDNISQHSRSQDTVSIVELGKQLLLSAKNGDIESVRELMCRGAPFTTDWLGTSALHFAAQSNHLEVAEVLLRAGISRDARTKVDKTPLHMAAYEGHHEMVQLLLNYGADVDSRDMLKMTPLHWAVERKHVGVMHILLDHGADTTAASKFSKTPISLALECDRLDLVDILQQERDVVVGIQQPQRTTELEIATHNLVHLEPESSRNLEEEQKFEVPQQHIPQHKYKLSQALGENERKKQKLMFQQIPVSPNNIEGDHEREFEDIEINVVNNIASKKYKDIASLGNLNKHFRLLEGITIPVDEDSSIVENAMESGRTVVLTEAGKLALNSTKGSLKRLQVASHKTSKKVIAIRTDQISTKLLNPNLNASTIARGPNILKRTVDKPGKLLVTTFGNNTMSIGKIKNSVLPKEKLGSSPLKAVLHENDVEEITGEDSTENNEKQITDIAVLTKQLAEARRQADEYRKQLQEKEREAEIYKQQLKSISAQIASK